MISYTTYGKRIVDLLFALLMFLLVWPVLIVIGIVSMVHYRKSPIFTQQRNGLHGKVFTMYKFRTMRELRDENGNLLPDEFRTDRWGNFLRKTSIDEIPQLLNVLKGEMSWIGPRPLLPRYYHRYSAFENRRHEVLPGVTGLAQVKGRNAISWAERFALDVFYVDNQSLTLDLKIMGWTLQQVIRRDGINAGEGIPIEPYDD